MSNITVQTDKQTSACAMSSASPSISTPPTSLDDEASIRSETTKLEHTMELYEQPPTLQPSEVAHEDAHPTPDTATSESRRPARSSRKSVTTYNVQILAGTAIHTPTKYLEKHHKNVLHGCLDEVAIKDNITPGKKRARKSMSDTADVDPVEEQLATETTQAARRRTSSRVSSLRKEVLRNVSGVGEAVSDALSGGRALAPGSLRRSASDSQLRSTESSSSAPSSKRRRTAIGVEDGTQEKGSQQPELVQPKRKTVTWLRQGLYVGQDRDFDPRLSESQNRVKRRTKKSRENEVLPLPMFACDRLLSEDPKHVYRDFKLPFDTYSPLSKKVKVDGWVKLHRSKTPLLHMQIVC